MKSFSEINSDFIIYHKDVGFYRVIYLKIMVVIPISRKYSFINQSIAILDSEIMNYNFNFLLLDHY